MLIKINHNLFVNDDFVSVIDYKPKSKELIVYLKDGSTVVTPNVAKDVRDYIFEQIEKQLTISNK